MLVDWHVWPRQLARLTSGASVLWARPGLQLTPFDGTVVDLTSSQTLRTIPPYSRQQRAEWELCMLQIAASRPARRQDARPIGAHLGLTFPDDSPNAQLDVLVRHLGTLEPGSRHAHGRPRGAGSTQSRRSSDEENRVAHASRC